MDLCGGEIWAYCGIVTVVGNVSLTDLIVNTGTSWSYTNLQVCTRSSSCAWMRQSTLHSRFRPLQLYMNYGSRYIVFVSLVSCWLVSNFFPSNTKQASVSPFTLTLWAENSSGGWLPKLSLVYPLLPLPSKWLNILCNNMLFFSLMSWWFHLSVFKFTFEACFACSAQYF